MSASVDPTFPIGAAIAFCTWRLLDKRKRRNPDGPFLGNSPVWGALGTSMLGLVVGGVVRTSYLTAHLRPMTLICMWMVWAGLVCCLAGRLAMPLQCNGNAAISADRVTSLDQFHSVPAGKLAARSVRAAAAVHPTRGFWHLYH